MQLQSWLVQPIIVRADLNFPVLSLLLKVERCNIKTKNLRYFIMVLHYPALLEMKIVGYVK